MFMRPLVVAAIAAASSAPGTVGAQSPFQADSLFGHSTDAILRLGANGGINLYFPSQSTFESITGTEFDRTNDRVIFHVVQNTNSALIAAINTSLDPPTIETLVDDLPYETKGVGYDPVADRVYWYDTPSSSIRSASVSGTSPRIVECAGRARSVVDGDRWHPRYVSRRERGRRDHRPPDLSP